MEPFYWPLLLLLFGLATVALELFIPSAGLLGILAGGFILASIIVAFATPPNYVFNGAVMLGLVAVILPLFAIAALKIWPSTPIGRRILIGQVTEEEVLPVGGHYDELKTLVGQSGVAKTKMLPSGIVVIAGRQHDAVSDGFAVEPGDSIEVIAIRTNKIVVRRVDPSEASSVSSDADDILSKPIDEVLEG